MSRIGKRQLTLPPGVTAVLDESKLRVKGPKGESELLVNPLIKVQIKDNLITTELKKKTKTAKIMQGTMNSLIYNMLTGVSSGYEVKLEIVGVGYKFALSGNQLILHVGYSQPVKVLIPSNLKLTLVSNTEITISGFQKQEVTEFAANVRKVRPPEPYKGKGIRYQDEYVRRKEGKKAAK